jgi:hypothetical protein
MEANLSSNQGEGRGCREEEREVSKMGKGRKKR